MEGSKFAIFQREIFDKNINLIKRIVRPLVQHQDTSGRSFNSIKSLWIRLSREEMVLALATDIHII
jgi:hypothetical protein